MQIEIIREPEDASKATGIAVVIDVFRAFSVEAYVFANGASKIIPVLTLDEAYLLKKENPEYVLIGERGGLKPEGFDHGNSPTEILHEDFSGKTIIHTTSNGTKGLANSINADVVLSGSFVIVGSIVRYIRQNNFQKVSLISTSQQSAIDNEDILCAYYIRDSLLGVDIDENKMIEMAKKAPASLFLLNELGVPTMDIDLSLDFNRFDFIIKKVTENGRMFLRKENIC